MCLSPNAYVSSPVARRRQAAPQHGTLRAVRRKQPQSGESVRVQKPSRPAALHTDARADFSSGTGGERASSVARRMKRSTQLSMPVYAASSPTPLCETVRHTWDIVRTAVSDGRTSARMRRPEVRVRVGGGTAVSLHLQG